MGAGDANFAAAIDQTGNRSLNSNFTNGGRRRMVYVSVICTAAVAGQAFAGFTTNAGGSSWSMPTIAGFPAGIIVIGRYQMVIPVDPGGVYSVTSSVTGTGTVTVQQWMEVDG